MKSFAAYCLSASLAFTSAAIASGAQSPATVPSKYGNLPLSFEANLGQASPEVKFLSRVNGYSLLLTDSSAVLWLNPPPACATGRDNVATPRQSEPRSAPCNSGTAQMIRMTLAGGVSLTHSAKPTGEAQLPGKANYFLGNDPSKWHPGVPTYARVRYPAVYPGVDLVYYGNQHQLEYDFIVAPGANPAQIQLNFTGQQHLNLTPDGDLILKGSSTSATLRKPILYQEGNGQRQPVSGRFKLLADNTVTFAIGNYDHSRALVIDPVLVYSTYLGGSGFSQNGNAVNGDQANGIAVDSAGNAYIVGTTYSANFPVTAGTFQSHSAVPAGLSTVFVSKLNPSGTALLYSTYIGGSGTAGGGPGTGTAAGGDFGYGIALSPNGEAFITGATYSSDFPITCGAFHNHNRAVSSSHGTTAFVTRLASGGSALLYSTYLGGNGPDVAQAIAVDPLGDAYVSGYTFSSNFPITPAAFQRNFTATIGHANAFVSRLNPAGTALQYSTFLGGTGSDAANAIVLDSAGNAYIAGSTGSSDFPVTGGTFQPSLTGPQNAFIAKLDPALKTELYSTFLGGSGSDSAQTLTIDSQGNAYVAGTTSSSDFPLTAGTVEGNGILSQAESVTVNGSVGFLTKLNSTASAQAYSTYIQGHGTTVSGIALDSSGAVYLAGAAATPGVNIFGGFQLTPDALPAPASTGTSAFLLKLDPAASVYNYATLLGGSASDGATSLAMDTTGNIYLAGYSTSTDFPVTTGAFQRVNGGGAVPGISNAFVSVFALQAEANQIAYPVLPTNVATSFTINSAAWVPGADYALNLDLTLNLGASGPPPTGTITVSGDGGGATIPIGEGNVDASFITADFSGGWNGPFEIGDLWLYGPLNFPVPGTTWQAWYSGDAVYQPATIIGTAQSPDNEVRPELASTGAVSAPPPVFAPKFIPPTAALTATAAENKPIAKTTAACIVPGLALTVTLDDAWRIYGAANPKFAYTLSGLAGSDTVTVTPTSAATATSPVGNYPILAKVTGADASEYAVTVEQGTLSVHKAPLHVEAKNAGMIYGQTPPLLTGYSFSGFLNGDTASVVSGAPVLTSTVTTQTPVAAYPISVQLGTLSAANYAITTAGNGQGSLWVYKATLVGKIDYQTMHQGDPVPPLTYTLTGFVNGDTAANSVTGAPVLTTTATSTSPPGKYPITATLGTLASHNYDFTAVSGVMTVLP